MRGAPEPLRHGLVSGLCLVTHNVVVIGADSAGAGLLGATLASFAVVVGLGYSLHARYTFAVAPSWRGFARYAGAMAASVPLSLLLLGLFVEVVGWRMAVAAPTATLLMLAVNYGLSRWSVAGSILLPKLRQEGA